MSRKQSYGDKLRKARKEAGRTLGDVAELLDRAVSYISDVEVGHRKPLPDTETVRVATFLGADAKELLEAAAKERGAVQLVTADPRRREIAAGLARSWERLTEEQLSKIREVVEEARDDEDE